MPTDPPLSRPRSRFARLAANREFTNRDGPIAHFDRARTDLPANTHRILTFYGVGGQGKTALRRHLLQRLADEQPRRHRFGALDFHEAPFREPARGLLELRRRLRESGSMRTPIFDVAITSYWERAYPGEDLTRTLGDLIGDSDGILGDLADSARDGLDVAADFPFGVGQSVKLLDRARRWLQKRGALQACDALRGLERLEAEQIADRLPWFLGLDLQAHRDAHPDTAAPVIFLDTYEALWSDRPDKTGIAALETDAWVRELVAATPGTLFVVLGRERLRWDKRFPDQWTGLLNDQHLLGGLAEADADRFLRRIPIDAPAVRRAIIDGASAEDGPDLPPGARGAHPFYVDLAVDTWLDLRADGIEPTPDTFGRTHPEVLSRFLRYRGDAERAALKVLAGPAAFDRELFRALMEHFRIPFPLTAFDEFCGLSIIEPGADGRWRLHALMREHLLADLDPGLRTDLAAFLFDWFDARCQPAGPKDIEPEHEMALREAMTYRDIANAEAALDWLWQRLGVFHAAARYTLLEPLCRWAVALAEDRLGPNHSATSTALNNLALLLQATNRVTEAEPLLRRALAIDEASFGAEHPTVARNLNNLATLLKATNRLAEAEPLMRRALAIDKASFGVEDPEVARDLNNLATLLQDTNRSAVAVPLMRRALAIDEASFGAEHPTVARDLNNLAGLLQDTNHPAEAEQLMRRALAIDEASIGAEHPSVATTINNLATLFQTTNRLAEAEPLLRRALAIDEASFGAEHPTVARDLNNLALLLWDTNRLPEAESLGRRGLLILLAFSRDTGHRHPDLETVCSNYLSLLRTQVSDPSVFRRHLDSLRAEADLDEALWQSLLTELLPE